MIKGNPIVRTDRFEFRKCKRFFTSYTSVHEIRAKKKGSGNVFKGMAIGGCIGLVPAIGIAIFGHGEGGAYVSVFTFPVGLITGGIVGASSIKKFRINGNKNSYTRFHSKVK